MGNMVEVDEDILVALRNRSGLLDKTLSNPKTRESLLRSIKAANPELPVPEIDAAQPINDALTKMNEQFADIRKELKEEKNARETAERNALLSHEWGLGRSKANKAGYAGDSLDALEKFMEEKGVADHEVAMAAFEKLHPQAKPVVNSGNRFDFFNKSAVKNNENLTELWKTGDENAFLGPQIDQILKEERGQAA